MTENIANS